ncbi:hypothetical protein ABPG72_000301 [Tetrahymena utriculariae]
MFGGLYPETGGQELLSDLTLEKIDYDWIEKQNKPNFLKKAIKLIEEDGNYFVDLKEACTQKLRKLDPSKAPKVFNNNVSDKEKQTLESDIYKWEEELQKKEQQKEKAAKIFEIEQQIQQSETLTEEQKKIKAENEKNKGNEALKSKDYKEAIEYYTKSIEYDPKLAASYCNRALVYLKLKEYDKVVKDCNKAIELDPNYLKAYHRRGKARFAQDKVYEAYSDFKLIMEKDPENKEVNGDLKECQDLLKKQNTNPEKGFKRVQIVEEEGDDDEQEQPENNTEKLGLEKKKFYDEQVNQIESQKEVANAHIKNGLFDNALQILQTCISKLTSIGSFSASAEDQNEYQRKMANYLNNIALCYKQLDDNKSVICYANQVIEMKKILSSDVLVKAYLRRAMAYERLEKYKRSFRDFLKVKHLDPGNLQSSQGMRRVQQCCQYDKEVLSESEDENENKQQETTTYDKSQVEIVEEEEMVLVKKSDSKYQNDSTNTETKQKLSAEVSNNEKKQDKLDRLTKLKEEGNALFTQKDVEGALKKFREVALEIEVNYSQRLNKKEPVVTQLYLQVLSNQSLCLLGQKKYEDVVKCTTSALYYQEANIKCLYRRAQAARALGDAISEEKTIENLKLKYEKYEKARKDLEKVNQLDNNNSAAKQLLQEVSKLGIEVKLSLRHLETEKLNQKNQELQEQDQHIKTEQTTKKESDQNQITSNLTTQDINKITEQALQSAADNMINDFKLPENSTVFEKDFNQLKNNRDKLYAYAKQIPGDHYAKLYDKNDIPSNILLAIVQVLQECGVSDNKEMCQNIIRGLTKTSKFNLCVKFLTKKEKKGVKDLLEAIGLGEATDLLEIFKL